MCKLLAQLLALGFQRTDVLVNAPKVRKPPAGCTQEGSEPRGSRHLAGE